MVRLTLHSVQVKHVVQCVQMSAEASSGDLCRKYDLHVRIQGVCVCVHE